MNDAGLKEEEDGVLIILRNLAGFDGLIDASFDWGSVAAFRNFVFRVLLLRTSAEVRETVMLN